MLKHYLSGIAILAGMAMPFQANAEIEDFEGYQGFVDVGYTFGTGSCGLNSIDITTSHGVQIIPTYLYTGVGAGFQYFHDEGKCSIPIFADVRSCFMGSENVTPFVDLKVGYSSILGGGGYVSDGGVFLSPTVGCTFVIKDFIALNAGIGYTFEQAKINTLDSRRNIGGFCIRLGVQF